MVASSGLVPAGDWMQLQALFDPETGLPGWALLIDRMGRAVARAQRLKRFAGVVAIEIVPAVPVAELKLVAARLSSLLRPDDTVSRLGPSLLAVACNDLRGDEDAARIAARLVRVGNGTWPCGVAVAHGHDDAIEVIGRAMRQLDAER